MRFFLHQALFMNKRLFLFFAVGRQVGQNQDFNHFNVKNRKFSFGLTWCCLYNTSVPFLRNFKKPFLHISAKICSTNLSYSLIHSAHKYLFVEFTTWVLSRNLMCLLASQFRRNFDEKTYSWIEKGLDPPPRPFTTKKFLGWSQSVFDI